MSRATSSDDKAILMLNLHGYVGGDWDFEFSESSAASVVNLCIEIELTSDDFMRVLKLMAEEEGHCHCEQHKPYPYTLLMLRTWLKKAHDTTTGHNRLGLQIEKVIKLLSQMWARVLSNVSPLRISQMVERISEVALLARMNLLSISSLLIKLAVVEKQQPDVHAQILCRHYTGDILSSWVAASGLKVAVEATPLEACQTHCDRFRSALVTVHYLGPQDQSDYTVMHAQPIDAAAIGEITRSQQLMKALNDYLLY